MERHEKYGENLLDEYNIKLEYVKKLFEKKYNNDIELINTRYSPNIMISSSSGNCSVEVNCWNVFHKNKIVGEIFSMFDNFKTYYLIDFNYHNS